MTDGETNKNFFYIYVLKNSLRLSLWCKTNGSCIIKIVFVFENVKKVDLSAKEIFHIYIEWIHND